MYNSDLVERVAHQCVAEGETLARVLYDDRAPFNGEFDLPVSGGKKEFAKPDTWLQTLAKRDYFAVRRGVLIFRGWKLKTLPAAAREPNDNDFTPDFEQKGVDMRIGLDVATFSENQSVDRLALITNDTDCAPAMKYARRAGLQIALINFPEAALRRNCYFTRTLGAPWRGLKESKPPVGKSLSYISTAAVPSRHGKGPRLSRADPRDGRLHRVIRPCLRGHQAVV